MNKTNKKALALKELRRIKERMEEIQDKIWTLPRTKLPNRIFAGHWRYFGVRADILRSSQGEVIQRIVDACNHWVLGNKKDPKTFRCSTEVLCWGLGIYPNSWQDGQWLRPLSQEQWDAAKFSEGIKKKYFRIGTFYHKVGTKNIPYFRYYPNIQEYMLEWKYKAAYIVEVGSKNGDLETEYHELRTIFDNNQGWTRLYGNHRDDWDLGWEKKKELKKIAAKELREETQQNYEDADT